MSEIKLNNKQKALVSELCNLYEYYGAKIEAIDHSLQRLGTTKTCNNDTKQTLESVKLLRKQLGFNDE